MSQTLFTRLTWFTGRVTADQTFSRKFVLTKHDHDFMFDLLNDPDAGKVLEPMRERGKGEGVVRHWRV